MIDDNYYIKLEHLPNLHYGKNEVVDMKKKKVGDDI